MAPSPRETNVGITSDSRVDDYIAGLPQWQRAVCQQLRDLVHRADPEIEETIKFGNRPYFVLKGNVCALLAARNHVCLFLYDGAIVPDPHGIITGGHDNETARQISFFEGDSVNREALLEMLKQIVANNRAGGWRNLSGASSSGSASSAISRASGSEEVAAGEGALRT